MKFKRLLSGTLALLMLGSGGMLPLNDKINHAGEFCISAAEAPEFIYEYWSAPEESDMFYAEIMGYEGTDESLTIPSTYKVYAEKFDETIICYVCRISDSVFEDNTHLKSVIIPDTITYIGGSAFSGCSLLTEIVLPTHLNMIEAHTFENCVNLENIIIPHTVTTIGEDAFKGCDSLTLTVAEDSWGEIYAKKNNIPYVTVPNPGKPFDVFK